MGLEDAIYGVIRTTPGLSDRNKTSDIKYLEQFFEDARDEKALHRRFAKQCKSA